MLASIAPFSARLAPIVAAAAHYVAAELFQGDALRSECSPVDETPRL